MTALPGVPPTWKSIDVVGSHMQSSRVCWGIQRESTFVIFATKREAKHADLGAPIRCSVCETLDPKLPIFGLRHDDSEYEPVRVSNHRDYLAFYRDFYYQNKEIFDVVAREFELPSEVQSGDVPSPDDSIGLFRDAAEEFFFVCSPPDA